MPEGHKNGEVVHRATRVARGEVERRLRRAVGKEQAPRRATKDLSDPIEIRKVIRKDRRLERLHGDDIVDDGIIVERLHVHYMASASSHRKTRRVELYGERRNNVTIRVV